MLPSEHLPIYQLSVVAGVCTKLDFSCQINSVTDKSVNMRNYFNKNVLILCIIISSSGRGLSFCVKAGQICDDRPDRSDVCLKAG